MCVIIRSKALIKVKIYLAFLYPRNFTFSQWKFAVPTIYNSLKKITFIGIELIFNNQQRNLYAYHHPPNPSMRDYVKSFDNSLR